MSITHFCLLPEASKPLLNKFYKAHKSPMRPANEAQLWVAKQQDIVGALCLSAVADGHWLTGLFVAPSLRGQSIASDLIREALAQTAGPVWLFCHPDLLGFYQRAGFEPESALPQTLAERFARYSRTKPLIAMSRPDPEL
jgi:GNAT superfamily N-acetyltransferase